VFHLVEIPRKGILNLCSGGYIDPSSKNNIQQWSLNEQENHIAISGNHNIGQPIACLQRIRG
jgi:hypothetical protein